MIVFMELDKESYSHVPINIALIKLFLSIYRFDQYLFIAEKHHLENVKIAFKNEINEMLFQSKVSLSGKGLMVFLKSSVEFYNFLKVVKKNPSLIILFSVCPITHFLIKLFKWFYNSQKIVIVLHGELEYINKPINIKLKVLGKFLSIALKIKNTPKMKYLFLNKMISKNIHKYIKTKIEENDFFSIEHPYEFNNQVEIFKEEKIVIGAIGIANKQKNSKNIFLLASRFKKEIDKNLLKFKIVGKIEKDVVPYKNSFVEYSDYNSLLPREEFEKQIKSIKYAIFFYTNGNYNLCPSGAILDAFKFEKPIIALKNDIVTYYFDLFGDIGYICNNIDEMEKVIYNLLFFESQECYLKQVNNLRKAKKFFSPEWQGNNLKNEMAEFIK